MNRKPGSPSKPAPPIHLQKQIVVDVDGVLVTVNHIFANDSKSNLRDMYEDFIERKMKNS